MAVAVVGGGSKRMGAGVRIAADAAPPHMPKHSRSLSLSVSAALSLVVQVDRDLDRLLRRRRPLEHLLRPVHAHEAVHLAVVDLRGGYLKFEFEFELSLNVLSLNF